MRVSKYLSNVCTIDRTEYIYLTYTTNKAIINFFELKVLYHGLHEEVFVIQTPWYQDY